MHTLSTLVPNDAQKNLIFFVNGKKVTEASPDPEWTLLWYLRKKLLLTGTKYGCGEGGCGACTVMVSQYLRIEDRVKHIAVNACLTPVCAMHGLAVTTVEGIGSTEDRLHPVQERIAKAHGSQCGFCTPGIVMSMYALLRSKGDIQYSDIETALQGNLCRCTGYRPIIEGFKTFVEGWEKHYNYEGKSEKKGLCAMGKECCRNNENKNSNNLFNKSLFQPYDSTQEPIFPPELKVDSRYMEEYLYYKGESVIWIRPKTLENLLAIKGQELNSKIVVGNSEIGIEIKFKNKLYPVLLCPSIISEMSSCNVSHEGVIVGATTTLTELDSFLDYQIKNNAKKAKIFDSLKDMLHWFAGNQVRNVASLVGNIITASPISDLNPILMACSAVLHVYSNERGYRKVVIDDTFFNGYRSTVIKADEVVVSVEIPFSEEMQYFKAYKQARRKDDDISIVTSAFSVKLDLISKTILEANICYGGMGPTTICANKTAKSLRRQKWDQNMLNTAFTLLSNELQLDISAPGGMAEYRKSLCLSLFFKFYLYVEHELHGFKLLNHTDFSAVQEISTCEPNSSQYYEIINKERVVSDTVGLPITHISALKQATGEALYCDDIPVVENELYLKLIFSSQAHAKIKSIDASKALLVPGVKLFLSAANLGEACNKIGPIIKDEEIFTSKIVTSRACVIGAIVATSESVARKAKDLVIVNYDPLEPVIVTLEDAILQRSFFPEYPQICRKGDTDDAFSKSIYIVEGHIRNGAQEHFYLETISAYAIRKEDELEIIAATQNPEEIAHLAAEALQIPNHRVVAKVKRIGGGFGGKETRTAILAIPVAIAAYKLRKPVRGVLDRNEDMQVSGYRHPCLIKYKVGFNDDGKINAVKFEIFSNAGNSMDISCLMIERALFHVDNCYYMPNVEVMTYLCKTNMPSNTAFRGFGAPQAMLAAETMIRHIAATLNRSYEEIVEINLYREGSMTHYNQMLTYCTLTRCWNECIQISNYWQRKNDIEVFNSQSRWKKKGIALVPTKYGISFQADVLMQAGALLLVYKDGSVLLSIGGIEMGQGLFTKMVQVASKALGIDYTKINISEMSTDKVPNSSPTAASVSSDLYGMAVLDACKTLKKRLKPFMIKNPNGKWEEWVMDAYLNRTQLSCTGFYAAPKIEYNRDTNSGNLFEYFTYGVACSEVIIDCLTGDHQVLRTDIVMDIGESLNPAIDIGQIEGAFMQGYGFYTLEEMIFSDRGEVLSRGPGTYKIPGFSDIPREFNVSLLKGAPNPRAVYSSKAVGEPPLFLASSIFFAIKEAIASARIDSGVSPEFVLDTPATCDRIRMACEDHITKQVKPTISKNGKPWNVVA